MQVTSRESSEVPDDLAVADRLENLQSLTDSTLTGLDVDDLLVELLARVRVILDVDTAAVLSLDRRANELVARATCGIEDEVRQGVRVPLGRGFAGRIAATKDAVRLDHVDSTTVTNPILWERGIKAMLGVPLLRNDTVLGVLHVGRLEQRPFDEQDVELLKVVADRVAGAMETRQHAIERAAGLMLERSLLPPTPPSTPELEFATRYVAAEDRTVGGDWYDHFRLPSGELWIVVGDVAGHGLEAAVVMGRIRSSLRSYALIDSSPARVLELVDRKMQHFESGVYATVRLRLRRAVLRQHDHRRGWTSTTCHRGAWATRRVRGSRRGSSDRSELRVSAFDDNDHARPRDRRRVLHRWPRRTPR